MGIAIPCNNEGAHSGGLTRSMLARVPAHAWHRLPVGDPEDTEKGEQAPAEKAVAKEEFQGEWTAPAPAPSSGRLGLRAHPGLKASRCPPGPSGRSCCGPGCSACR